MKLSSAILEIYKSAKKLDQPEKAKHYLASLMANILHDLEEQKIEITEEELEKKFTEEANFCMNHSKKDEVA